ncbi:hypothetical protein ACH4ZX_08990 [Streptomyces sp. NPDC020490]|uniref:hypothetical protein n=1 Tax=Streptomyces sp. NPDC020490 TaxID=3365078 RepID=UPI0037A83E04
MQIALDLLVWMLMLALSGKAADENSLSAVIRSFGSFVVLFLRSNGYLHRGGHPDRFGSGGGADFVMPVPEAYGLPGSLTDYLPDPFEPVDRWFQARNASNVRTTVRIVQDLCPGADLFVDPLAGGGSSACAARLLGVSFFGLELDPVLACVSLAKSTATARHARADPLWRVTPDQDDPVASCLDVTRRLSAGTDRPVSRADMLDDLERNAPAPTLPLVLWADATQPDVWDELHAEARHAVLYTSPPFGLSSPRPQASPELYADAVTALASAEAARAESGPAKFASYEELAADVVVNAARRLGHVTAVLEHEPADDGSDARESTVRLLLDSLGNRVKSLRILECGAYSRRGMFSLIVCEVVP